MAVEVPVELCALRVERLELGERGVVAVDVGVEGEPLRLERVLTLEDRRPFAVEVVLRGEGPRVRAGVEVVRCRR